MATSSPSPASTHSSPSDYEPDPRSPTPPPEPRRGRGRGKGKGRAKTGRGRGVQKRGQGRRQGRGRGDGEHEEVGGQGPTRGRKRSSVRRRLTDDQGPATKRRRGGASTSEVDRIQEMQNLRIQSLRTSIQTLTRELIEDLLIALIDRMPSLVFDVLDAVERVEPPSSPLPSGSAPPWCKCSHCVPMHSDIENLCCGLQPRNCISLRPEIGLYILNPQVIALANQQRADIFADRFEVDNRGMRHGAYRLYVLWRHGRLGAGNRRVIPSCVVTRVRATFPDVNGQYTGFMPSRLV